MAQISSTVVDEVNAAAHAWRENATHVVLVVLAAVGLPFVTLVALGRYLVLPWPARLASIAVYGVILLATVMRKWDYRVRAVLLFFSLYALTVAKFMHNGLVGHGRIGLIVLPLLALILLGAKEGWIAAAITALMLAVFTLLAGTGVLARWLVIRDNTLDPGHWTMQSVLLLASLLPLLILFTKFAGLQKRIMVAEQEARRKLEEEAAARRRLESEILRVDEEERRRLGSELHDSLCQNLTAALLHAAAVENQLSTNNPAAAEPASRLRTMIEESIGMAYDVAKGLCPVDLNPESLVSALQRLARSTQITTGIRCEVHSLGHVTIQDAEAILHLYRIAQEGVANAVKHAQCGRIAMELQDTDDAVVLRIRDDGTPTSDEDPKRAGGMGLQVMAYRAGAMGGTLTIDHPDEGGTILICRAPKTTS